MSLPADYFDRMYAASPDPWGFASRWYEQRKYALTLAALPEPTYGVGLELGCSVGVLTAGLAQRCGRLVAMDLSAAALRSARGRVPEHVELVRGAVPQDWPPGRYDLVVVSEVAYYLSPADLDRLLDLLARDLTPAGTVLACHWRHRVADYPQTGDAVHERFNQRWPRVSRVAEEDFLIDVFAPGGAVSVARRSGLLG